jgi:predicted HicB family RNase H-like nuclease
MSGQNARLKRSELSAIGTRFDPEVRKIIEEEAAADRRSVAHWVEKVVIDHLKAKGRLPA